MLVRSRKCPWKLFIIAVLLTLLTVNILAYFFLDVWSIGASDPFSSPDQKVDKSISTVNKKPHKSSAAKLVDVQRQTFVLAEDHSETASGRAAEKILDILEDICERYNVSSTAHNYILQSLLNSLSSNKKTHLHAVEDWVTGTQVVPANVTELGSVLTTLCSLKIIKADISKKGTQLKLLLTLESGWKALFKPQWYERDAIIHGAVYAGKDRHNAEVAAFHLSLLLDMRRVPLTVGRRIDLRREVMPVATPVLRNTFFQEGNNTCFYGVCHYCSPSDPVCARRDVIEGALILWLPQKIKFARYTHPWQRTYKDHLLARWEVEASYCERVKNTKAYALNTSNRLLDLVDTAIFDFLIDNGDRHHYEAPLNIKLTHVFLFDNGKSFGDPNIDHLDILAPLYQCCLLRKTTWERLFKFQGGVLGTSLQEIMQSSHISPVLTSDHLAALDRRLLLIFAAIEICLRDNPHRPVLV